MLDLRPCFECVEAESYSRWVSGLWRGSVRHWVPPAHLSYVTGTLSDPNPDPTLIFNLKFKDSSSHSKEGAKSREKFIENTFPNEHRNTRVLLIASGTWFFSPLPSVACFAKRKRWGVATRIATR